MPDQASSRRKRNAQSNAFVTAGFRWLGAITYGLILNASNSVENWVVLTFSGSLVVLGTLSLLSLLVGPRMERAASRLRMLSRTVTLLLFALLPWFARPIETYDQLALALAYVSLTSVTTSSAAPFVLKRSWNTSINLTLALSYIAAFLYHQSFSSAALLAVWALAVNHYSQVGFDVVRDLRELQTSAKVSARRDRLTGLLNRTAFIEQLARASAIDEHHILLLIDLDGFKAINQSHGHKAGDAVLGQVGSRLKTMLPRSSVIGRIGGDEFGAVIPIDAARAQQATHGYVSGLTSAVEYEGNHLYLAASAGWTEVVPGLPPPELMAQADDAMARSKRSLVDHSSGFTAEMQAGVVRDLDLRQRFRSVVREARVDYVAQPIVRVCDRAPVGVELLARWPLDDQQIEAEDFSQLADETGLAVELDCLALTQARDLLAKWRHDPCLSRVVVKVNISPLHLHNRVLAQSIRQLIPRQDWTRLGLEFVESRFMAPDGQTVDLLRDLRDMGITISIDDFGTGYSSLAYLRTLPVSEVKIDKTFVRSTDCDPVNAGLVQAIVQIANALELDTIAEGVESEDEMAALSTLGVSAVQGFLTGRPMEIDTLTAALHQLFERSHPIADPTS